MADIHQVISLGIGSPADIPHFILFGLSPTGVVDTIDPAPVYIVIPADDHTIVIPADDHTIVIPAE